jgi:hypothetical protein
MRDDGLKEVVGLGDRRAIEVAVELVWAASGPRSGGVPDRGDSASTPPFVSGPPTGCLSRLLRK